jgi:hypothetical protein
VVAGRIRHVTFSGGNEKIPSDPTQSIKNFLLLSFLAFINFTSFYSFSFYDFLVRRQQQPREISYFLINFWDASWEGRDLFVGMEGRMERAGAKRKRESTPSGQKRNQSQPEAETLEIDFLPRKTSFHTMS